MVAAACSSSKKTAATATTAASGGGTSGSATAAGCPSTPDASLDGQNGTGAAEMAQWIACGNAKPVKAQGAPITIGLINMQGDPAGTFPDVTASTQAAVAYINNDLGGVGGDLAHGKAGRPLQLTTCFMKANPADAVTCGNQVAAAKPLATINGLNFFSETTNKTLLGVGIPVYSVVPITVADFTTPKAFGVGDSGGCVGVHLGLIDFAVNTLHAKRVMVPWANSPPGVVCYYDLEKKPLKVLEGQLQVPGVSPVPGLVDGAVSIPVGQADDSAAASQIMAFKPDVIVYSAQSSDCFTLLNALSGLGWSSSKIPLVLTTSCADASQIKNAGDPVKGVYFVGANNADAPDAYTGLTKTEMLTYQDKLKKYGGGQTSTGFAGYAFETTMTLYQLINNTAAKVGGIDQVNSSNLTDFTAKTVNYHQFAGRPISCGQPPDPYVAICATQVSVTQWTGDAWKLVAPSVDGTKLVKGLPIQTGP